MKKSTKINKKIAIAIMGALSVLLFVFCIFGISNLKLDDFNSDINSQLFLSNKSITIDSNQQGVKLQENTNIQNITNNKNKDNAYIIKENQYENSQAAEKSEEKAKQTNIRTANILDSINFEDLNTMASPKRVYSSNGNVLSYKIEEEKNTLYIDKQQTSEGWTDFDSANAAPWVNKNTMIIKHVVIGNDQSEDTIRPTSTKGWFGCMAEPTSGVQPLSNIEDIKGLDKLDMSDVTDATCMFIGSDYLKTPQVSDTWFDKLNKVESAACICCYTKKLDNNFLNKMINGIANSVVNAKFSFADNPKLTEVTIADKDNAMKNVLDVSFMFRRDKELTKITSGNLIGQNTTTVKAMFTNCSKLERIYLNDDVNWSEMTGLTDSTDLFYNCIKLKGGKDTLFDLGKVDKEYARQDGGPDSATPGYFTATTPPGEKEAYAVYDAGTATLTFYYDENRGIYPEGTTYTVNASGNDGQPYLVQQQTTKVIISENFHNFELTDTVKMFNNLTGLKTIENIKNLNTLNVENMNSMFLWCRSINSIDFKDFDTSKVKNMSSMFRGCSGFSTLDITSFNTSKVEDMSHMFEHCSGLSSSDFTFFDTSSVKDMNCMFIGSSGTNTLTLTNFNTENVTDMSNMFFGCGGLETLDITSFNTEKVTDMSNMFFDCSGLSYLTLTNFNTENVTNMYGMFSGCKGLKTLDITSFNTEKVTDMSCMFSEDEALVELNLSSFNTRSVSNFRFMFLGCIKLITIYCNKDYNNWNTATVSSSDFMFQDDLLLEGRDGTTYDRSHTDAEYARLDGVYGPGYFTATTPPGEKEAYAVYDADTATLTFYYDENRGTYPKGTTYTVNASGNDWQPYLVQQQTTKVIISENFHNFELTDTVKMFSNLTGLKTIENIKNLNTLNVENMNSMFSWCRSINSIDFKDFDTSKVKNMSSMFRGCSGFSTLDITSFNTSKVEDMSHMFEHCSGLSSSDFTFFDTSSVKDMNCMFIGSSGTNTLTLTNFNTENVTDMSNMFFGCGGLETLDITSFNTEKVTDMSNMFFDCSGLSYLTLTNFNTENVTNMYGMFSGCKGLKTLDITSFNTEKVTDMSCMFSEDEALVELNLSSFNTRSVSNFRFMFLGCIKLITIYCNKDYNNWNTATVSSSDFMFQDDLLLEGRDGTTYDRSHTDAEYARLDSVYGPGYFSVKE